MIKIVSWKLNIPENEIDLIAYRIKASSELFTDSEEKFIREYSRTLV